VNKAGVKFVSTTTSDPYSTTGQKASNGTIEAKTRLGRLGYNGCGEHKGTKKGQQQGNFPMHDDLHIGIVFDQKWHVDLGFGIVSRSLQDRPTARLAFR
jgi:hypothetical protein